MESSITAIEFGAKALFASHSTVSLQPVLEVVKLVEYRPEFYGGPMGLVTKVAMRGASTWPVADRELMTAFVANNNPCEFCTKAHSGRGAGVSRRTNDRGAVIQPRRRGSPGASEGNTASANVFAAMKLEEQIDAGIKHSHGYFAFADFCLISHL